LTQSLRYLSVCSGIEAAHNAGAFVCVALGADAAIEALQVYLEGRK